MPPAALAEDGALGVELHAPLEALLGAAVLADAHVVGRDAYMRNFFRFYKYALKLHIGMLQVTF